MQAIKCEVCGSGDLIKQDGVFVCQHCGTKYSIEEAKKLLDSVKIDKTEDVENWYVLARRALDVNDMDEAQEYYKKILQVDPYSWEAYFFNELISCYSMKIREFNNCIDRLENCIYQTFELVKNQVNKFDMIDRILGTVLEESLSLVTSVCLAIKDSHYMITDEHDRVMDLFLQIEKSLKTMFPEQKGRLDYFYKQYLHFLKDMLKNISFFKKKGEMKRITNLISET